MARALLSGSYHLMFDAKKLCLELFYLACGTPFQWVGQEGTEPKYRLGTIPERTEEIPKSCFSCIFRAVDLQLSGTYVPSTNLLLVHMQSTPSRPYHLLEVQLFP